MQETSTVLTWHDMHLLICIATLSLPWARREALQVLIPRILGAGAVEDPGEQHDDAAGEVEEGRPALNLEGLDPGRVLALMRDRTSSHLMEARSLHVCN